MKKARIIGIITLIILSVGTLLIISHNKSLAAPSEELGGTLAIMVYDESLSDYVKQDTVPKGDYLLNLDKTHCTAKGKIKNYESTTGTLTYSLSTADQCYVYFDILDSITISPGETLATEIKKLGYSNTMSEDSSWGIINENGFRYEGEDPSNYVCFGSEEATCPEDNLYRIIGSFETEYDSDENGIAESIGYLTKIRKEAYYNNFTQYHSTAHTETTINSHYPNSLFYTVFNDTWYGSLDSSYQSKIVNVKWHLGGVQNSYQSLPVGDFYIQERGIVVNTGVTEAEKVFKIGMIYASDYGYGVLSSNCARTTPMYNYYNDCYSKNWMRESNHHWTLTPLIHDTYSIVFIGHDTGFSIGNVDGYRLAYPTFYLNPDIKVAGGSGTYADPYRISL